MIRYGERLKHALAPTPETPRTAICGYALPGKRDKYRRIIDDRDQVTCAACRTALTLADPAWTPPDLKALRDGNYDKELVARQKKSATEMERVYGPESESTEPDWTRKCGNCNETPVMPLTGMCGPCTFGEAETIGGNW